VSFSSLKAIFIKNILCGNQSVSHYIHSTDKIPGLSLPSLQSEMNEISWKFANEYSGIRYGNDSYGLTPETDQTALKLLDGPMADVSNQFSLALKLWRRRDFSGNWITLTSTAHTFTDSSFLQDCDGQLHGSIPSKPGKFVAYESIVCQQVFGLLRVASKGCKLPGCCEQPYLFGVGDIKRTCLHPSSH
jgi:hypothetical protein